jgi:GDPmannose 4,6-dehydratase
MPSPLALIVGATGQDGAYLARHLLGLGYRVYGTSRDHLATPLSRLHRLGIDGRVTMLSMSPVDFRSVFQTVATLEPDEIYNLSGQSSVGLSFEQPAETVESIVTGTLNLLEAVRIARPQARLFNAGSSECFGSTDRPVNEHSAFDPRSPYGVAKVAAVHLVKTYRRAYGLFACSGITFNHESPLRSERFFTRKVVTAAVRIHRGSGERLTLGDLSPTRDWGWAPDFVEAFHKLLAQPEPVDAVVGTGVGVSLQRIVEVAFAEVGLDHRRHVDVTQALARPSDIDHIVADPRFAAERLGWVPTLAGEAVIRRLVAAELTDSPE